MIRSIRDLNGSCRDLLTDRGLGGTKAELKSKVGNPMVNMGR